MTVNLQFQWGSQGPWLRLPMSRCPPEHAGCHTYQQHGATGSHASLSKGGCWFLASGPINQKTLPLRQALCHIPPRQYVVYIPRDTAGGAGFLFDVLVPGKHFIYKKYFFIIQLYRFSAVCSMTACLYCVCTLVFRNSLFIQQKPVQCF